LVYERAHRHRRIVSVGYPVAALIGMTGYSALSVAIVARWWCCTAGAWCR